MNNRTPIDVFTEVAEHKIEMEGYFAHYLCLNCSFETSPRPQHLEIYPLRDSSKDKDKEEFCECGKEASFTRYQKLSWGSKEGYVPLCRECTIKLLEEAREREVSWLKNLNFRCECKGH